MQHRWVRAPVIRVLMEARAMKQHRVIPTDVIAEPATVEPTARLVGAFFLTVEVFG